MVREAKQMNVEIICFRESYLPGYQGMGNSQTDQTSESLSAALEKVRNITAENLIAFIIPHAGAGMFLVSPLAPIYANRWCVAFVFGLINRSVISRQYCDENGINEATSYYRFSRSREKMPLPAVLYWLTGPASVSI